MWRFLYRAAWALARPLAAALSYGDLKLARAARGRRAAAGAIRAWAVGGRDQARPLVWFHAASVGEGRQAEAVLVRLRSARPDWQVAFTFSSPSAERFASALPTDYAGYVPLDTVADTASALETARPTALVFGATDVWPELALQAAARGVALALISATLAPSSSRRGRLARAVLGAAYAALDRVGAIDEADARALEAMGVAGDRIVVTGDTRHDAAAARAAVIDRRSLPLALLEEGGGRPILVAGSTWPDDERALLPAVRDALGAGIPLRLVIAPHEPSSRHLAELEGRIRAAMGPGTAVRRLSALEAEAAPGGGASGVWDVCVVDRVGVLADLYAAARIAYVGGGFGRSGLHSVIEPAALGVPVLFGPRWQGSRDARLLLESGGGRCAAHAEELARTLLEWLGNEPARATAGAAARAVVERGLGAAERSVQLVIDLVERSGR